jgi:hypothetical protein
VGVSERQKRQRGTLRAAQNGKSFKNGKEKAKILRYLLIREQKLHGAEEHV